MSNQDASQAQGEVDAAVEVIRAHARRLGVRITVVADPAPGATAQDGDKARNACFGAIVEISGTRPPWVRDNDRLLMRRKGSGVWTGRSWYGFNWNDFDAIRAEADHPHYATPTPTIPAGMVAWNGGDSAPADWAGPGSLTIGRLGQELNPGAGPIYWRWATDDDRSDPDLDIIAYTPLAAAPKQAEQQGMEALRAADQAVVKMMAQSDAELVIDTMKAMRADDVKAAVRAWLDADDATHWGAFEVALHAAVEGVSERDSVVAMLQADAETMRQNATAYSEEAPTDARALHEVAATLAFKAAQIKRGAHLAALNAPTGAVEKGEAK